MSKEEFLKIQTCVLKVNIHCDGCKSKVKKTLQKIDGVYKILIDSEMGKVTVSGNVDPATLIKKLGKSGKHAELWGPPKANQGNQNQLNAQFKNQHSDNGKSGNKGQKGGGNQQKAGAGGGGGQPGLNPQQLQLLQMKGFQDMKLPQLKDLKMPFSKDQNQKAVKFNLPEEDDMSYDEFDCFDDEDYDDDDELDDEFGGALNPAPNKMKPIMGNGQMPNLMMLNGQQLPPQFMNAQAKGGNGANNNGGNAKKGGGGNVPIQVNDGKNDHGGKKGGGGGKNGGKNGGGNPGEGKNGNNSGGAQSKNGNGGHGGGGGGNCNNNGNGGKKGGGINDGVQGLPNMGSGFQGMAGGHMGQIGGMPMGPMGHLPMGQMSHLPMGQMGQMPAVQGLPAGPLNAGGGGGGGVGGYLNGAGQEGLAGNSYQQHLAAAMMNQQRANGNERFQPMMYARPPPAVNYMPPPYPYPYPYPPPPDHPYTHAFSDESTSSCSVM
ncbi:heavy metal-associated isoprenylated plant protein 32-like [Diospyros lotus]|uniref:heavy metal-associated isoprenylated plant protein 32-like n=1 Tax=Diospyros lotus TaxID=55363 RepID=UPI0022571D44|nr:heavy metal-associated isoprenylated plant protein 32-like [Diospyros lotus]XP_052191081.1 heavy metal-associated isoprenylated plant protein 32-like [Diospyros lotus]